MTFARSKTSSFCTFFAMVLFSALAYAEEQVSKNEQAKSDEQLAQELFEHFKAYTKSAPQPKWEKVWTTPLTLIPNQFLFSQDGSRFVLVQKKVTCEVHNTQDGKLVDKWNTKKLGQPWGAVLSPSGAQLLVAVAGTNNVLWDIKSKTIVNSHDGTAKIYAHTITPDGEKTLSLDDNGTLHIDPLLKGEGIAIPRNANLRKKNSPINVSISPDCKRIVTWNSFDYHLESIHLDPDLKKENIKSTQKETLPHNMPANLICSNREIIYLRATGEVIVQNYDGLGEQNRRYVLEDTPYYGKQLNAVMSADGKTAAFHSHTLITMVSTANPFDRVFINTPDPFLEDYKIDQMFSAILSPDMQHILTTSDRKELTLWKAANPGYLDRFSGPSAMVELIKRKKFDLIERVYLQLDESPEIQKYNLVTSITTKYLECLAFLLDREINVKEKFNPSDLFAQWTDNTPDNTIGRILAAKMTIKMARRILQEDDDDDVTAVPKEERKEKSTALADMAFDIIEPVMKRNHIPCDALEVWMNLSRMSTKVNETVSDIEKRVFEHHPLHSVLCRYMVNSYLHRNADGKNVAQNFCRHLAEQVEEDYADALFASTVQRIPYEGISFGTNLFTLKKADNSDFDLDFDRMYRGADQMMKLFPENPAGASLGLCIAVRQQNEEKVKKYVDILTEKHGGLIEQRFLYTSTFINSKASLGEAIKQRKEKSSASAK